MDTSSLDRLRASLEAQRMLWEALEAVLEAAPAARRMVVTEVFPEIFGVDVARLAVETDIPAADASPIEGAWLSLPRGTVARLTGAEGWYAGPATPALHAVTREVEALAQSVLLLRCDATALPGLLILGSRHREGFTGFAAGPETLSSFRRMLSRLLGE